MVGTICGITQFYYCARSSVRLLQLTIGVLELVTTLRHCIIVIILTRTKTMLAG